MTTLGMFENLLEDPMMMGCDLKNEKMDLLSTSIQESGLFNDNTEVRLHVCCNIWRRFPRVVAACFLQEIC